VATNSAKKNGVGDHPSFKAELYATKKAIEYASGVVLFEDSTSEHAAALAREKVGSTQSTACASSFYAPIFLLLSSFLPPPMIVCIYFENLKFALSNLHQVSHRRNYYFLNYYFP
jgi:hypothetical protein